MGRSYTLKKRAEKQEETRQRIIEAAVDLHGTVGPARTTISLLAERAGVQRHTIYAHFPDDLSLHMACSGLAMARDPLPDPSEWQDINDQYRRLRAGLNALYTWYERNAQLTACVLRDAETVPATKEAVELRTGPPMTAIGESLGEGLSFGQRALLQLALSFHTWKTLSQDSGLAPDTAAETMARAVHGLDRN